VAPLHEVCVVYSGVGCGLRSFGPYHPLPHPPPAAGPPPHQLSGQGGRVDGINEQAGDRARVGPPPCHHPFIPTNHPATMQDHPHLPCQHRMGVYTTTPFTHPHHHASHLSHSPRWRSRPVLGTTPHCLAGQHWAAPPQTHAVNIPHHAFSGPPPQAQDGGEATNRQCGPGILAQVRVNRSGPRVARVVGRRRARLLFGIVLWCEHTALTLNFFIPHPRRPALERVPTDASGQGCGYRCRRISRSSGCCA